MMGSLKPNEIEQLLSSQLVGRIGCQAEGRIYVVPITYAYDGRSVYGHSSQGMKLRFMRANPEVCFEVDRFEGLQHWQSVIAWGTFEELHGEEARAGMHLLLTKLSPLLHPVNGHALPGHGVSPSTHGGSAASNTATVFRIVLKEKTGRMED